MRSAMQFGYCAVGLAGLVLGGCSGAPKTDRAEVERASVDILHKQLAVDTLYLTDEGGEFIAPGNRNNAAVDPATHKLAWAAWQCNNPACPGRRSDGQPFLFAWPHPFLYVKEDGTVGMRDPETEEDYRQIEAYGEKQCPACLKNRDLSAETEDERRQYQLWCSMHVLPQAVEQRKQLAEEYRQFLKKN